MLKEMNLWDSNFSKYYEWYDSIEEYLDALEKGEDNTLIEFKESYHPGETVNTMLEQKALEAEIILKYIDKEHSVCIGTSMFDSATYMDQQFFDLHQTEIKEAILKKILKEERTVYIPNFVFDDNLLDQLLEKQIDINLYDVKLTEEQIEKMKSSYLQINLFQKGEKTEISSKYLIGYNTKEDLEKKNSITIEENITDKEISHLKFLQEPTIIKMSPASHRDTSYYDKIAHILKQMNQLNKKIIFKMEVEKRNFLENSPILTEQYENVDIIINNDFFDYTKNQYQEEENRLNEMVRHIKESNMSPFEKYIACYNIVKKFKPYKENEEDKNQSRSIRYILDNEYMVCVGFQKLLTELLDKVGIESCNYSTTVYQSKLDETKTTSEEIEYMGGHARVLVHMQDKKYGIDGYYIADPTWDNNRLIGDKYNYILSTMDSMQTSKELFGLTNIDLVLDVHNIEEYVEKVNRYLEKKMRNSFTKNDFHGELLQAYSTIYRQIMDLFYSIDIKEYQRLSKYEESPKEKRDEVFYQKFLTEVGYHVVKKSNQRVTDEKIADAITAVKTQGIEVDKAYLLAYKDSILEQKQADYTHLFPYQIPENDFSRINLEESHVK